MDHAGVGRKPSCVAGATALVLVLFACSSEPSAAPDEPSGSATTETREAPSARCLRAARRSVEPFSWEWSWVVDLAHGDLPGDTLRAGRKWSSWWTRNERRLAAAGCDASPEQQAVAAAAPDGRRLGLADADRLEPLLNEWARALRITRFERGLEPSRVCRIDGQEAVTARWFVEYDELGDRRAVRPYVEVVNLGDRRVWGMYYARAQVADPSREVREVREVRWGGSSAESYAVPPGERMIELLGNARGRPLLVGTGGEVVAMVVEVGVDAPSPGCLVTARAP